MSVDEAPMGEDVDVPPGADRWSVALIVHHFPIISETFVATLAAELVPRVGDLRILATDGAAAPGPHHPVVARAGLLDRLHLSRKEGRLDLVRMARLVRSAGGPRLKLAAMGAAGAVAPPARTALMRMLVAQPDFDVVHCQFGYEGLAVLRHRRLGILRTRALVCHLRGSDITKFVREKGEDVYDGLFAEAEVLIANCEHFRQRAIALGAAPDKVVVVGSPIDTERFAPPVAPREPYGDRPLRLVAVGRLVGKKGFEDAVAAMARLDGLDATLDILGEGPLRAPIEAMIAELGLEGRVCLHGAATSDQVLAALHRADVALAPSVTAETGDADAPVNTLKEAMATELPVIATEHGGIPELVLPGVNGMLVPERDADALAAAIRDMAGRSESWPEMGARGRAKVIEDYGLEPVARKTLAAYSKALRGKDAR
jgi:colanic acid/amylovoran biosynthesis glycosyltransferase